MTFIYKWRVILKTPLCRILSGVYGLKWQVTHVWVKMTSNTCMNMWYNQRLIRLGGFSLTCDVDTILLTVNKSASNGWIISMVFNCRWIHPHTWSPGGWHGLVWMGPPQFESGSVSSWGYFQHQSVSPETHHSSGLQTPGGPVWRTADGLRNRLILSETLWNTFS